MASWPSVAAPALDLGKMVAFMSGQTRPIWDFEDIGDWWTRADADAIAPIVAVPTTAGTGSEVGRASVIANSETQGKEDHLPSEGVADRRDMPTPNSPSACPSRSRQEPGWMPSPIAWRPTVRPFYHPMSQGIALEGMRLVQRECPARAIRRRHATLKRAPT